MPRPSNVKKLPATTTSFCGSVAGARSHDARKEFRCPACKKAWNYYYRTYRAMQKGTA